ncbi:cation:proton antiporter [Candidatus Aenigmatarchaeota archaeon]
MVEINILGILAIFGFTIMIGYIGSLIFNKTRIPDVFWLLLFGFFLGPILGFADRQMFLLVTPFLSSIALLIILFDAGLHLNFYQLIRGAPRSTLLAIVNIVLGTFVIGGISIYIFNTDMLTGLLIGVMLGGTSSPIVLSIVNKLSIRSQIKTLLSLESIFTDALVIVIAIALMNIIAFTEIAVSPVQAVVSSFSIGAVFGLFFGILWLFVLEKLKGKSFDYMLTLAALFLIYVSVEVLAGSGAIASLLFGMVLGNGKIFSNIMKTRMMVGADHLLKTFQSEVSFFIRSFFFVLLGIIFVFTSDFVVILFYGVFISLILIVLRFVAVQFSVIKMKVDKHDMNMMRIMTPRGLAPAVLAQIAFTYAIPGAELISNIILVVILITVLYTSFSVRFLSKKMTYGGKPKLQREYKLANRELKSIEKKELKKEYSLAKRELKTIEKKEKELGGSKKSLHHKIKHKLKKKKVRHLYFTPK